VKILAIQNKMGIGDTVIYLPFIKEISRKFQSPVSLLTKTSTKAEEFLNQTTYIDQIIYQKKNDGILGSIKLAGELNKYNFEKVFIFNSSLRFNLISRLAGIKKIYQYPLFEKKNQHIIGAAKKLIKDNLVLKLMKILKFKLTKT
jgi:heptosyltransferase-2